LRFDVGADAENTVSGDIKVQDDHPAEDTHPKTVCDNDWSGTTMKQEQMPVSP
jgi:hypothetical protein